MGRNQDTHIKWTAECGRGNKENLPSEGKSLCWKANVPSAWRKWIMKGHKTFG